MEPMHNAILNIIKTGNYIHLQKSEDKISSRLGVERRVDNLVKPEDSIIDIVKNYGMISRTWKVIE